MVIAIDSSVISMRHINSVSMAPFIIPSTCACGLAIFSVTKGNVKFDERERLFIL